MRVDEVESGSMMKMALKDGIHESDERRGWGSGVGQHLRSAGKQQRSRGHRGHSQKPQREEEKQRRVMSWKAGESSERDLCVCVSAGTRSRPVHLRTAAPLQPVEGGHCGRQLLVRVRSAA